MPVKVEHYFYFRPMQIIITLQLSPVCANAIYIIIIQHIEPLVSSIHIISYLMYTGLLEIDRFLIVFN